VVALGEQGGRERPRNPKLRVVESDGDVLGRVMRAVDPVGDVRGLGKRLKSMGTTGRDIDRLACVVSELEGLPSKEGRRVAPEVDDDIEYGAI
jgi:hypothetical protein